MPDGREVRLVFDKYQKVVNPFTLYAALPYIYLRPPKTEKLSFSYQLLITFIILFRVIFTLKKSVLV